MIDRLELREEEELDDCLELREAEELEARLLNQN